MAQIHCRMKRVLFIFSLGWIRRAGSFAIDNAWNRTVKIKDFAGRGGRARTCDNRFWRPTGSVFTDTTSPRCAFFCEVFSVARERPIPLRYVLYSGVWVQTWVQDVRRPHPASVRKLGAIRLLIMVRVPPVHQ